MRRWKTCLYPLPAATCARTTMAASRYWPLWELTISRMRMFYREPASVFWVHAFPLVMALSLGTAFRENSKESIAADVVGGGSSRLKVTPPLLADSRFKVVE